MRHEEAYQLNIWQDAITESAIIFWEHIALDLHSAETQEEKILANIPVALNRRVLHDQHFMKTLHSAMFYFTPMEAEVGGRAVKRVASEMTALEGIAKQYGIDKAMPVWEIGLNLLGIKTFSTLKTLPGIHIGIEKYWIVNRFIDEYLRLVFDAIFKQLNVNPVRLNTIYQIIGRTYMGDLSALYHVIRNESQMTKALCYTAVELRNGKVFGKCGNAFCASLEKDIARNIMSTDFNDMDEGKVYQLILNIHPCNTASKDVFFLIKQAMKLAIIRFDYDMINNAIEGDLKRFKDQNVVPLHNKIDEQIRAYINISMNRIFEEVQTITYCHTNCLRQS